MAVLRDLSGNREYPLKGKITLLGRDPTCDIVVSTERTSWRHALVFYSNQGYAIEDLESVNGTFVNGRRIQQRTTLHSRDRVEIPGLQVVFHEDTPLATTPGESWQAGPSAHGPDGSHERSTPEAVSPLPKSMPAENPCPDPSSARPRFAADLEDLPIFTGLEVGKPQSLMPQAGEPDELSILSSLEVGGVGRLEVRPEAKLRAILEISQALSNTLQLDEALPRVLDRLFSIFPHADRGFILLRDGDTGQLTTKAVRNRLPGASEELPLSQGILNHALTSGRAILSADAGQDERFDPYQSIQRFRIGSIMCVPILSQSGERFGIIQIDTRDKRHPFCEEDLEVLIAATTMTARAVELARWHRQQSDLEAATRIQKSFLPAHRPQVPGLTFFDYYAAARVIGGDYYDYIPLPDQRLAVALGDVSGKGVSAALLMARLSAAVRFSLATEPRLAQTVRSLNTMMMQVEADHFITFVVGVIDLTDYSMTLVNAGHPPVLCKSGSRGQVQEIGEPEVGLPLGVFDRPYEEVRIHLQPGDTLVFYTDGITEARNPQGDFYGCDRLRSLVESGPADAVALGETILADVRRFAAGRLQSDDLTLVCVSRH